jgi:hypothetical protein
VLATLTLSDTLTLSSVLSSRGGAEASSGTTSVETGRRRIRVDGGERGVGFGALTRDWRDARYSSSWFDSDGISIRKPVRLSWLWEMWIWGGSVGIWGTSSLSRRIGGAEASRSGSVVVGGAEGRRACSRCARADLLILARELALGLRACPGPPASVMPAGLDTPRVNGGGGGG